MNMESTGSPGRVPAEQTTNSCTTVPEPSERVSAGKAVCVLTLLIQILGAACESARKARRKQQSFLPLPLDLGRSQEMATGDRNMTRKWYQGASSKARAVLSFYDGHRTAPPYGESWL